MAEMPRILLCDKSPAVCQAFRKVFVDETEIEIVEGDIAQALEMCDAVVSPANSFGFMDGGFDAALSEIFGPLLKEDVQGVIIQQFGGELLVGQAFSVPTEKGCTVIVAPTMRVPKQIMDPADVFLATRAAVRCAARVGVRKLAIPGMGTGTGMVHPVPAAWAMLAAIDDVRNPRGFPTSMHDAKHHHHKTALPKFGGT